MSADLETKLKFAHEQIAALEAALKASVDQETHSTIKKALAAQNQTIHDLRTYYAQIQDDLAKAGTRIAELNVENEKLRTPEREHDHRLRCRIGWHRWSQWEVAARGTLKTWIGRRPAVLQERHCYDCKKLGQQAISADL